MIPVFDGHNDFLLRLLRKPAEREKIWLKGEGKGHLDLPRMRAGGLAGGFFAVYIPSPDADASIDLDALMDAPPYDLPLPGPVGANTAQPVAAAMIGHLMWMERTGTLSICRSVAEIRAAMAAGRIAAILHFEGAEPIGEDLDTLHLWHAAGLRSLGPVWSRPTAFGHGVPFRFPGEPDTGPGLTEAGKRLVAECDRLHILIDLSHLNEKGFDDVAALSGAPLVATHSNAHAVTPSTRNLTDRQLAAIRASGGMVGLNFATVFLRHDGRRASFDGWEPVLRHLDHLIEHLGEDHVGFGSDFDGAMVPEAIGDACGLPRLLDALAAHGYGEALIRKLAHENWLAVLDRTWGR
ncbi:dipeptidase [Defluviimonas sp. D31]|uniref:dipeptidase n=1 Tax=Defluviimonas sp. D31 TaxID=3083253 RepID=UPI0029700778|nr:dipeptidase [Defluviimonas sp. D31]MDW4550991.1 dipeptidase [Defluviimonas sp. D31]